MKKIVEINFSEGEGLERVDFKGTVTLKRLNFSEKNMLEEESTEIKNFGNVPQVKVSTSKMKEISLVKGICESNLEKITYHEDKVSKEAKPISSKYELNITGIKNLPVEIGEELFVEFYQLNNVSKKKN